MKKYSVRSMTLAVLAVVAGSALMAGSAAARSGVSVRVEGPNSTLVPLTTVQLHAGSITKDGNSADSCSGLSGAGALQVATRGHWNATWYNSPPGYLVTTIYGVDLPTTGTMYWNLWFDGKPATLGVCGLMPKAGDSILLFPDCATPGASCVSPNVLGMSAPTVALVGHKVMVKVTSYANADGKPSPAVGATVSGGGKQATTASGGHAQLTFTRAGNVTLRATAPNSIRSETHVLCVHRKGDGRCGTRKG